MILAAGFTEHESLVWAMALFALVEFDVARASQRRLGAA